MVVALKTEEQRAALAAELEQTKKEMQELKDSVQKRAEAEMTELKNKSDLLAESLRNKWNKAMPNVSFEHASSLIDSVRKDDPKLGHELLELIECASQRSVELQASLSAAEGQAKRTVLEERYKQMLLSNGSATSADTTQTTSSAAAAVAAPPAAAPANAPEPAAMHNPYSAQLKQFNTAQPVRQRFEQQAQLIQSAFTNIGAGNATSRLPRASVRVQIRP